LAAAAVCSAANRQASIGPVCPGKGNGVVLLLLLLLAVPRSLNLGTAQPASPRLALPSPLRVRRLLAERGGRGPPVVFFHLRVRPRAFFLISSCLLHA